MNENVFIGHVLVKTYFTSGGDVSASSSIVLQHGTDLFEIESGGVPMCAGNKFQISDGLPDNPIVFVGVRCAAVRGMQQERRRGWAPQLCRSTYPMLGFRNCLHSHKGFRPGRIFHMHQMKMFPIRRRVDSRTGFFGPIVCKSFPNQDAVRFVHAVDVVEIKFVLARNQIFPRLSTVDALP